MDDLDVQPGLVIPAAELVETTSRSGGPGGQHVNKTATRVTLRWSVANSAALTDDQRHALLERLASRLTSEGDLLLNVDSSRSQLQNRLDARDRLATIVREALVVVRKRRKTKPTKGSSQRRMDAKKIRSGVKKGRGRVDE